MFAVDVIKKIKVNDSKNQKIFFFLPVGKQNLPIPKISFVIITAESPA